MNYHRLDSMILKNYHLAAGLVSHSCREQSSMVHCVNGAEQDVYNSKDLAGKAIDLEAAL
jgi:hypothetical protein